MSLAKRFFIFLGIFLMVYVFVFIFLTVQDIYQWVKTKIILKQENRSEQESVFPFTEKIDSIFIPKINIDAPLVYPKTFSKSIIEIYLQKGVVFYPSSDFREGKGKAILLGHSAPPGWPPIRYDNVFSNLNKLENGDDIFLFFQNRQYRFAVAEKTFLEKGEELPPEVVNSNSSLILISCWPPGRNIMRIIVKANLKK